MKGSSCSTARQVCIRGYVAVWTQTGNSVDATWDAYFSGALCSHYFSIYFALGWELAGWLRHGISWGRIYAKWSGLRRRRGRTLNLRLCFLATARKVCSLDPRDLALCSRWKWKGGRDAISSGDGSRTQQFSLRRWCQISPSSFFPSQGLKRSRKLLADPR